MDSKKSKLKTKQNKTKEKEKKKKRKKVAPFQDGNQITNSALQSKNAVCTFCIFSIDIFLLLLIITVGAERLSARRGR